VAKGVAKVWLNRTLVGQVYSTILHLLSVTVFATRDGSRPERRTSPHTNSPQVVQFLSNKRFP